MTDDFSDNDEQVTIDEDSGEKTGNVIDGVSVDGPVTVQSFSIAGQTGPFVLGQVYTIAGVGSFSLAANGAYSFTPADNYNGAVPVVTYVLTDGSSTNASTLSISVTPVTDDFSDNDEQVTIDEDSGEKTGNVIDGVSVDGPVTVQSFSIAGQTGPFVLGQVYTIAGVGSFSLAANGAYSFTPADNYNGAVPVVTYVLTDGSSTNASTLSISVTPVTDDFSDNDEQVTIDEDSGEKTGNVIDGVSVDGRDGAELSIRVRQVHLCWVRYTPLRCGQLQPGGERGVQLTPATTTRRGPGHLCADDGAAPTRDPEHQRPR
ncbi:hypothetical protein FKF78_11870 [Aeromonas hydrophila]|nr:hypothetical protein [Aeromonas hydrophila]